MAYLTSHVIGQMLKMELRRSLSRLTKTRGALLFIKGHFVEIGSKRLKQERKFLGHSLGHSLGRFWRQIFCHSSFLVGGVCRD